MSRRPNLCRWLNQGKRDEFALFVRLLSGMNPLLQFVGSVLRSFGCITAELLTWEGNAEAAFAVDVVMIVQAELVGFGEFAGDE